MVKLNQQEFDLLAAVSWIAPPSLRATQSDRIRRALDSPEFDWNLFTALIQRHRIGPIADAVLRDLAPSRLPDSAQAEVRRIALSGATRALRHAAECVRLCHLYALHNIDVIPLKGALLSERLFGDAGMRDVRDIDLLVRAADLGRADAALRAEGYKRTFPDFEPTPQMLRRLLEQEWHFTYQHPSGSIEIELHWRFDLWPADIVGLLWDSSRPREWMGAQVRDLPDGYLLLMLCDHGARHKWFCLKWLADVAVLLAVMDESGAAACVELAARLDLERPLAQATILAGQIHRIPPPAAIQALIRREPLAPPLAEEAMQAILGSEADHFAAESGRRWISARRYASQLRKRIPLTDMLLGHLLRAADFKEIRLPDRLFWLYYLLRPALWLRRRGV